MMVSLRYATKSTSDNVWALCDLIRDNKCDEIIFLLVKKMILKTSMQSGTITFLLLSP